MKLYEPTSKMTQSPSRVKWKEPFRQWSFLCHLLCYRSEPRTRQRYILKIPAPQKVERGDVAKGPFSSCFSCVTAEQWRDEIIAVHAEENLAHASEFVLQFFCPIRFFSRVVEDRASSYDHDKHS